MLTPATINIIFEIVSLLHVFCFATGIGAAVFLEAIVSHQLFASIAIIIMLTLNIAAIGTLVLARLERHVGRSILTIPRKQFAFMGGIMGFSTACWLSALATGAIAHFRTITATTLSCIFPPVLSAGFGAGMLVARFVPRHGAAAASRGI